MCTCDVYPNRTPCCVSKCHSASWLPGNRSVWNVAVWDQPKVSISSIKRHISLSAHHSPTPPPLSLQLLAEV